MTKLPYSEGSIFLVPLEGGGYARGVVARLAPKGKILFGYFFGPRIQLASGIQCNALNAADALFSKRFGDLGLIKNLWPVIGTVPDWDRSEWPILDTVRRDDLGRMKPVRVRYADDDPSRVVGEARLEGGADLPTDGLAGYGFVQSMLSKILAKDV